MAHHPAMSVVDPYSVSHEARNQYDWVQPDRDDRGCGVAQRRVHSPELPAAGRLRNGCSRLNGSGADAAREGAPGLGDDLKLPALGLSV